MTNLTLMNLTVRDLTALGDAALMIGEVNFAKGFYQRLVALDPGSPTSRARLGLALQPNRRSKAMLKVIQAIEPIPHSTVFVGEGIATWLKVPAFFSDDRFMALAAKDRDLSPSGISNWHWNLQTVLWAAQQAIGLPGDFVELGVYKGHTTMFLAEYLEFGGRDKRWWLYDTFEGVPADQRDAGREGMSTSDYGAAFSFEEVRDRFAPFGNIDVIQGRVPEVFAEACPDRIAFLHIDLNNATAEVAALDALYERLSPGAVIVFDDFGWASSHAQFKAEMDWFRDRGLPIFPLPTGQGMFVKPPV